MQALDQCGWPVSERDIQLLEKEIKQAEIYLQQSQELRNASVNKDSENESGDESEQGSVKNEDEAENEEVSSKHSHLLVWCPSMLVCVLCS